MSLMRACRALAVFVVAVAAAFFVATPAYAIDTGFTYEINPEHNVGNCVDVANQSLGPAGVGQFPCNDQDNQRFRFERVSGTVYRIHPVHSGNGMCLDVTESSQLNKAKLTQFPCNGQTNQLFRLLDDNLAAAGTVTRIQAVHSQKCLDIPGLSNAVVQVEQFTCNGGLNQKFALTAFAS